MKKIIGLIAGTLLSALPMAAFASVDNVLFDNGSGSNSVSSGGTINLHAFVSSSGQDVESAYISFPGAGGQAQQGWCYDISPDQIGTSPVGGWNIEIPNVTAPVASGVWPVQITTYGFSGDAADNNCTNSGAMTFGPTNFNGRVTVTASNSNGQVTQNSGGSSTGTALGGTDQMSQIMAALTALISKLTTTPAPAPVPVPTVSVACAGYAQASAGAMQGTKNDANGRLQGFLISQGASIPLLQNNQAPYGFYGNQTALALSWFLSMNHCQ